MQVDEAASQLGQVEARAATAGARMNAAEAQVQSLKAELAILLGAGADGGEIEKPTAAGAGDDDDDGADEDAGERRAIKRKLQAAHKAVAATRAELEAAVEKAVSMESETHTLRAAVAEAERRAIRALDGLSTEAAEARNRDAKLRAAEAAAVSRSETLQAELQTAGQRVLELKRECVCVPRLTERSPQPVGFCDRQLTLWDRTKLCVGLCSTDGGSVRSVRCCLVGTRRNCSVRS